jgi:hypothetical protein
VRTEKLARLGGVILGCCTTLPAGRPAGGGTVYAYPDDDPVEWTERRGNSQETSEPDQRLEKRGTY